MVDIHRVNVGAIGSSNRLRCGRIAVGAENGLATLGGREWESDVLLRAGFVSIRPGTDLLDSAFLAKLDVEDNSHPCMAVDHRSDAFASEA